jgi:hypothetical protein
MLPLFPPSAHVAHYLESAECKDNAKSGALGLKPLKSYRSAEALRHPKARAN